MKNLILITSLIVATFTTSAFEIKSQNSINLKPNLQLVCFKSESEGSGTKSESDGTGTKSESDGTGTKSESDGTGIKGESRCFTVMLNK